MMKINQFFILKLLFLIKLNKYNLLLIISKKQLKLNEYINNSKSFHKINS